MIFQVVPQMFTWMKKKDNEYVFWDDMWNEETQISNLDDGCETKQKLDTLKNKIDNDK